MSVRETNASVSLRTTGISLRCAYAWAWASDALRTADTWWPVRRSAGSIRVSAMSLAPMRPQRRDGWLIIVPPGSSLPGGGARRIGHHHGQAALFEVAAQVGRGFVIDDDGSDAGQVGNLERCDAFELRGVDKQNDLIGDRHHLTFGVGIERVAAVHHTIAHRRGSEQQGSDAQPRVAGHCRGAREGLRLRVQDTTDPDDLDPRAFGELHHDRERVGDDLQRCLRGEQPRRLEPGGSGVDAQQLPRLRGDVFDGLIGDRSLGLGVAAAAQRKVGAWPRLYRRYHTAVGAAHEVVGLELRDVAADSDPRDTQLVAQVGDAAETVPLDEIDDGESTRGGAAVAKALDGTGGPTVSHADGTFLAVSDLAVSESTKRAIGAAARLQSSASGRTSWW